MDQFLKICSVSPHTLEILINKKKKKKNKNKIIAVGYTTVHRWLQEKKPDGRIKCRI
jgi:S-adenosylmethionine:tRNA-ribosyltransferase-isomerase (queuine synthetase)